MPRTGRGSRRRWNSFRWKKRRRRGRRIFSKKQKKAIRAISRGDDNVYWANYDHGDITSMSGSVGVRDLPNTQGKANRNIQFQIDDNSAVAANGAGFVHLPLCDMEPPTNDENTSTDVTAIVTSNKIKLLGCKVNMQIRAGKLKDDQENVAVRIIWGWHFPVPTEGWGVTPSRSDTYMPKPSDLYTVTQRPAQANKGINDVLYPWPKNRRDNDSSVKGKYKILGNKVVVVNSGPTAGKEDQGTREAWATINFGRKIIEWHMVEGSPMLTYAPGKRTAGTSNFLPMECGEPFVMAYVHTDRATDPTNYAYAAKIKFESRVYWQNLE